MTLPFIVLASPSMAYSALVVATGYRVPHESREALEDALAHYAAGRVLFDFFYSQRIKVTTLFLL